MKILKSLYSKPLRSDTSVGQMREIEGNALEKDIRTHLTVHTGYSPRVRPK